MPSSKVFNGVTAPIWKYVKEKSLEEHGTIYKSTSLTGGTASTDVTAIGTIVLNYDYDAANNTVTYSVKEKPFIVPVNEIWKGIQKTISGYSN